MWCYHYQPFAFDQVFSNAHMQLLITSRYFSPLSRPPMESYSAGTDLYALIYYLFILWVDSLVAHSHYWCIINILACWNAAFGCSSAVVSIPIRIGRQWVSDCSHFLERICKFSASKALQQYVVSSGKRCVTWPMWAWFYIVPTVLYWRRIRGHRIDIKPICICKCNAANTV